MENATPATKVEKRSVTADAVVLNSEAVSVVSSSWADGSPKVVANVGARVLITARGIDQLTTVGVSHAFKSEEAAQMWLDTLDLLPGAETSDEAPNMMAVPNVELLERDWTDAEGQAHLAWEFKTGSYNPLKSDAVDALLARLGSSAE